MKREPKGAHASPKTLKLERTGQVALYRHKGKTVAFPVIQIRNGADMNQISHHLLTPEGDIISERDLGPSHQFIRYTQDDENKDGQ